MTFIRLLITVTVIHDLKIHQIDVKITSLNGDPDGKIYMGQLEGFIKLSQESKVCKLTKCFYDLK